MIELTPRQREVVELIGGEGLSYPEAAARLGHYREGGRTIQPESVRKYANDIRDRMGVDKKPRRALWELYTRSDEWSI